MMFKYFFLKLHCPLLNIRKNEHCSSWTRPSRLWMLLSSTKTRRSPRDRGSCGRQAACSPNGRWTWWPNSPTCLPLKLELCFVNTLIRSDTVWVSSNDLVCEVIGWHFSVLVHGGEFYSKTCKLLSVGKASYCSTKSLLNNNNTCTSVFITATWKRLACVVTFTLFWQM